MCHFTTDEAYIIQRNVNVEFKYLWTPNHNAQDPGYNLATNKAQPDGDGQENGRIRMDIIMLDPCQIKSGKL